MTDESFLPKNSFSGSKKNKLGPAGHLTGKMKRPARSGDLVGETLSNYRYVVYVGGDQKTQHSDLADAQSTKEFFQRKFPLDDVYILDNDNKTKIYEGVIISYTANGDPKNPQVAIIGGAGSYSYKNLFKKAVIELTKILEFIKNDQIDNALNMTETLKNTLSTIQAAKKELEAKWFGEAKQRLDPKCWKGYRKQGTKMKGGVRVNNCVKINEAWENQISTLIKRLENK